MRASSPAFVGKPNAWAVRGPAGLTRFLAIAAWLWASAPLGAITALAAPTSPPPSEALTGAPDLTQVQLEDLMSLEVTSVSRREQRLGDIAAAVTVISHDQIRASGATSLAEVLRLVPGLQVARLDASKWSISARGFSGRIANKLLVLVDGRSVYSPVFSGVYWDEQDLMLGDVERIEVIRGPGASVWGANAVNGVINVITRDAHDSQGASFSALAGTAELGGGSARWGGQFGSSGAYRVFARGSAVSAGNVGGQDIGWDSWHQYHAGFRIDASAWPRSTWTVTGDLRRGNTGMSLDEATDTPPYSVRIEPRTRSAGGNLVASWRTALSDHSDVTAQSYVDIADRNDEQLRSHVETYDLDLKHHFSSTRHDIVWGMDGRVVRDRLDSTSLVQFVPDHESRSLLGAFAQDEIALVGRAVRLTLGLKAEHTEIAGLEWQPTARVLWNPNASQSVWTAVSRAVRTPSRAETDFRYHVQTVATGGPPAVVTLEGNPNFQSEDLLAYEVGYRIAPTRATLLELTGFYNQYSDLRTIEPGTVTFVPTPSPHMDVRQVWSNKMHGDTRGLEASAAWAVTPSWKLDAGGSCLAMRLHRDSDSQDAGAEDTGNNEPTYQLSLQSRFDPTPAWEWNTSVYQVGSRASQHVKAYTRLDAGFIWKPFRNTELNLLGKNLLLDRHLEDDGRLSGLIPTEVERSVTARIRVRF